MNKMKLLFFVCFVLAASQLGLAQQVQVRGYLTDSLSGEGLVGAYISTQDNKTFCQTNEYGYFSITVEANSCLEASYVGYQSKVVCSNEFKGELIKIQLANATLATIVVEADKNEAERTQMSRVEIPLQMFENIPSIAGETDIIKALALAPGVVGGAEGISNLIVRGGNPDQNLILLDGIVVYNLTHLGGLASIFNSDAIKKVELLKGGFPARYGGRLSSVLDITLKEGNKKKFSGGFTTGLIATKLAFEVPIIKEKTTFSLSARSTYLELLTYEKKQRFNNKQEGYYAGYNLYDLNLKLAHYFDDKNQLYVSFYKGDDFSFSESQELKEPKYEDKSMNGFSWGNTTLSVRYNSVLAKNFFLKTWLGYTTYYFNNNAETFKQEPLNNSLVDIFKKNSSEFSLHDYIFKAYFDVASIKKHNIKPGLELIHHTVLPTNIYRLTKRNDIKTEEINVNLDSTRSVESSLFIEDSWHVSNRMTILAGLRNTMFFVGTKTFYNLEPRLAFSLMLKPNLALKGSYSRMNQYIHVLSGNGPEFPNDVWVSVDDISLKPMASDLFALGINKSFTKTGIEFVLETYYKEMYDLVDYTQNGATIYALEANWRSQIEGNGRGKTFGLELGLTKKEGRLNFMLSYTLAWNWRKFESINNNTWFPYKYDRRHVLSLYASYELSKHWTVSGLFTYYSGHAFTLPSSVITSTRDGYVDRLYNYSFRNNARMPDYHRFDLSISYQWRTKKKGVLNKFSLDIYNFYDRQNALYLEMKVDEVRDNFGKLISATPYVSQVSLWGILPSLSYSMKF